MTPGEPPHGDGAAAGVALHLRRYAPLVAGDGVAHLDRPRAPFETPIRGTPFRASHSGRAAA